MKRRLLLFFILFSSLVTAQNNIYRSGGITQTVGAPTFTPGASGNIVAIDTVTGEWYVNQNRLSGSSWISAGYRLTNISGSVPPAYTPTAHQSHFVVNAANELYYWDGSAWQSVGDGSTDALRLKFIVVNKSGGTLNKGEVVYVSGAQGNRVAVKKALASVDSLSANTLGVMDETVANNGEGYCVAEGLVSGINTSAFTEGAALYLSPTTAGGITQTKTTAPDHLVLIGYCVKSNAGSGEISVHIQNGYELGELHDVYVPSPTNGQVLTYNTTNTRWEAATVADQSATNELQTIDTFSLSGQTLSASLSNDAQAAKTVTLPVTNITAGTGISVSSTTGNYTVTNSAPDQTVSIANGGGITPSGTYPNFTLTATDQSATNEIQRLDTLSLSGQTLSASLLNDGVAASSVTLPIVDVAAGTNVTVSKANGVATVNALASQLSGVTGYVSQFNSSTTIDTTGMFWNGRLGIGTASPAARFHTVGSGNTSGTWTAQFHNSAGNNNALMIRDDGSIGIGNNTPNATLDVFGNTDIQNPNSNFDGGVLGAELLSDLGWTTTGWTGSFGAGFTHTVGNTNVLSNTLSASNGSYYQIAYTVTGRTAGSFVVSFGGLSTSSITASGSFGPRATSTAALSVTPTSDFDGTIVLSIRLISNRSAVLTLYNSAGAATNQILANNAISNTSVGLASMQKITTGVANTAFGQSAMANTTTGSNNIAFGFSALKSNTTGNNNVAMGSLSLLSNTFGSSNTAIGSQTLITNTTGDSNTAIGIAALAANTTGSNNMSIGAFSSYQNTTGTSNIAIGVNALERNTTGNDNIALGRLAIFNNTTGSENTVVGRSAGANSTTALTGNSNTLIGYSSAANIEGAASGNLVIGNNINLPTANGSSQINIKNIIFATGASGTGTTIAGSVGIGVNTPTGRLNIRGENASGGTNAFLVQNSTPSDIYKIENDGKISYWATNTAAGTTGAQTINRPSGTVNFGIGASSLVVTNSLCTTSSIVFATVRTNDATAQIKNVVPAAGSFTINLSAAATAETSVGFFIIN